MLFNSWIFLGFFAVVYAGYLLSSRSLRIQNLLLLVASYVFYGAWSWKFLGLIGLSTAIDYIAGRRISRAPNQKTRKGWATISIVSNLSILALFKYFNFFIESLNDLLLMVGVEGAMPSLSLVLPVGISFYTFQSMSYTIDVYRGDTKAAENPLNFALYVAFFPQLVAGPIERSSRFLPQVESPRRVDLAKVESGLWLIIWGLFKKVVIADNAATLANPVFEEMGAHSGAELWIAALAFTIQIYGDFSGYSDMARGLARLMGFELCLNFKLPYIAISPSDFWRRWHISLSSWLRDYLYIPLGGNRDGRWMTYRNLSLTMLLGGLWHGAAWNFIIWGAYHGLILVIYRLAQEQGQGRGILPKDRLWSDGLRVVVMFGLTVVGWIIFRVQSAGDLLVFAERCTIPTKVDVELAWVKLLALWAPLVAMQTAQWARDDLNVALRLPWVLRSALYALLIISTIVFAGESAEFIYFQF